jgi:hypothetical protein
VEINMPETQKVFAIATPTMGTTFDDMVPLLPHRGGAHLGALQEGHRP